MDLVIYSNIILKLLMHVELLLQNYVYNGYQAMADTLKAPLGIAATLYIGCMGYGISQGKIPINMPTFMSTSIKLGIIYVFAMHWGHFSNVVVTLFQEGAEDLGNTLLHATPIELPDFAGTGINGAMQSVLIAFTEIGAWSWEQSSARNISPYFTALIIWGCGYILVAFTLLQIIVAKIMLAILFCLAPLFFSFTLFKSTQPFFDRWLGALASYSFLLIIIYTVAGFSMNMAYWVIADHYSNAGSNLSLVSFTPVMIVCLVSIGLVSHTASITKHIGSTISSTSNTNMFSQNIGSVLLHGVSVIGTSPKTSGTTINELASSNKLVKTKHKSSSAASHHKVYSRVSN